MKRKPLLLAVSLLLVQPCAFSADWFHAGSDSQVNAYIDRDSILREGNSVHFWVKEIYKKPQKYIDTPLYMTKAKMLADCVNKSITVEYMVLYKNKTGDSFKRWKPDNEMDPVIPDTITESEVTMACTAASISSAADIAARSSGSSSSSSRSQRGEDPPSPRPR